MDIENEIEEINQKINSVDSTSNDFTALKLKKEYLADRKQKLQREYEEKRYRNQKNSEEGKRIIANECFFTLKTMLYGINEASILKQKLEYIHDNSTRTDGEEWLSNSIDELMGIYDEFKSEYIGK